MKSIYQLMKCHLCGTGAYYYRVQSSEGKPLRGHSQWQEMVIESDGKVRCKECPKRYDNE